MQGADVAVDDHAVDVELVLLRRVHVGRLPAVSVLMLPAKGYL